MTLTAVPSVVVRASGFQFDSSCPECGGDWILEAASRGRDDLGHPCREVRAALYCEPCQLEQVVVVVYTPPTRRRGQGKRKA